MSESDNTAPDPSDEVEFDAAAYRAGRTSAALAPQEPESDDGAPKFVVVYVASVLFELPGTHPIVTLREEQWPYRTLAFPVGLPEAQAMALAIESVAGARPSTYELFSDALRANQCDIVAARIVREERGVYYGELDLMSPRGRTVLDCRPTDAIILALRQGVAAPILIDSSLLKD